MDLLEGAVATRVQQKFASVRGGGRGDQVVVEIVWSPYEADAKLVRSCVSMDAVLLSLLQIRVGSKA